MCRVPCAVRSWLLPDFVDDASPVKLRTAQPGSRHIGPCIAYRLDFIYLEFALVSKYFAEALGCVNLFTKFVDGVHSVNVACTHDFEFLDDETRLWLRLQKIDGEPRELEVLFEFISASSDIYWRKKVFSAQEKFKFLIAYQR